MQSRVNEPYVVAVATFGGVVYEVTNVGRVIALIDILRTHAPVEFEARQPDSAAHAGLWQRSISPKL
ncbi:hypothetical protein CU103_29775 [Phyllobacterium sophorae]|uniref:Uncharacterized protein n=1 Tax=Phyllobacterium sophorae TaxID=1520277 RepID=A0A2P7AQ75_9HYPH|nr:hypothetical protein CU103_29775 [Phyllobacterium sophorae]